MPIQSALPPEAVGDALCVLEFLSCFKPVFDFDLPANLSFGAFFAQLIAIVAGDRVRL